MDKSLFKRIVNQLLPDMTDADERKALIESALYDSPVLDRIKWSGASRGFTVRLVRTLEDFGEIEAGKPAIVALLEDLREQVGDDRQKQIDDILKAFTSKPPPEDITAPDKTFDEGELYVFISYARPQQPIAETIEQFLSSAGVKVFRDTSEIREGANWDMTIETALQESQRMVLLLSSASMPYRKEVHREWFFFDQQRKPIYPIYVEDCDLHSRMYAYNYIDARESLQTALDRLLAELKRDFDLPEAITGADKVSVIPDVDTEDRDLPDTIQAMWDAINQPDTDVILTEEQALELRTYKPANLREYRLGRVAEWSLPRYRLDKRFVNLTLLLDKGEQEQQRWQKADDFRFDDLRDVLAKIDDPALVLLGAPGSGKSSLIRRLQLDHSIDQLRDDGDELTFFIQLNGYRAREA